MYTLKYICNKDLDKSWWLYKNHKIGDIIEVSNDKVRHILKFCKPINKFVYNTKAIKCKECNRTYQKKVKYIIEVY